MKEIRAYIQPFMLPRVTQTLPRVTQALLKIPGFPGMNVPDCEGFDRNPVEDGFTPYTSIQAANTHHSNAGKVYLIEASKNGRINDGASRNSS